MSAVADWHPSLGQQIAELKRELGVRRAVFPNWIAKGTLKQRDADYRVACLEAALKTLETFSEGSSHTIPPREAPLGS